MLQPLLRGGCDMDVLQAVEAGEHREALGTAGGDSPALSRLL